MISSLIIIMLKFIAFSAHKSFLPSVFCREIFLFVHLCGVNTFWDPAALSKAHGNNTKLTD